MRLVVHTPADFDRGPVFVEAVLKSLHRANPRRLPVTLELGPVGPTVGLIADVPAELRSVLTAQLADACPGVRIDVLPQEALNAADALVWHRQLRLTPDVASSRRKSRRSSSIRGRIRTVSLTRNAECSAAPAAMTKNWRLNARARAFVSA